MHTQHKMITQQDTISIGSSEVRVPPLGVGTWQWGDTSFWQYGTDYNKSDAVAAFWASIRAGLTLFDTAEVYGSGVSERIVGQLVRSTERPTVVATKYMPLPWRLTQSAVHTALQHSLDRLGMQQIDLYQVHQPISLLSNERLMDALADAVQDGKVRTVGVSNYSAEKMRRAHDALARRGVPLVSNQVQYSLLNRAPETNGVLDACRELGVTLIAYSPLAQGLLTGKYTTDNQPGGLRRFTSNFRKHNVARAQAVVRLLSEIGEQHGGKTPSQVSLNWLIQRSTLPIPGAKNARQAEQNAGALGWVLTHGTWSAWTWPRRRGSSATSDGVYLAYPPAGSETYGRTCRVLLAYHWQIHVCVAARRAGHGR